MGELPVFFTQNSLGHGDLQLCIHHVQQRHPGCDIEALGDQGGCSYTIAIKSAHQRSDEKINDHDDQSFIIQFRLLKHAVRMSTAQDATEWYSSLAPAMQELDEIITSNGTKMQMCRMSFVKGVSFEAVRPAGECLDDGALQKYRNLIRSLVDFFVSSWTYGKHLRTEGNAPRCDGKVGSTILDRLRALEQLLPSEALRSFAHGVRMQVTEGVIDQSPIVLTHGDLIPSNILVDPKTWVITGVVDWAEAEYLPFGISFYSVDHLLGCLEKSLEYARGSRFVYDGGATELRRLFWTLLGLRIPELGEGRVLEAVQVARHVGVLLWHGFAWDDGKIDRVVDAKHPDDEEELAYLTAFLSIEPMSTKLKL